MNARSDTERILDAYLAPEADRLADRVIDSALDQIARTPQRRTLRVPWRFTHMPALSRSSGIAVLALVAVVGASGLLYINSRSSSGSGGSAAPTTQAATTSPSTATSPAASEVAPGILAWTAYTSDVYGFQMSYPSDWSVHARATRKWRDTDGRAPADSWPYADVFVNPDQVDGDSIGIWVWEMPAGNTVDIESTDGLKAWAQQFCTETPALREGGSACQGFADGAVSMCLVAGGDACRSAILVPDTGAATAFFMDWPSVILTSSPDMVRVVQIGRPDEFPASARYGGVVQLLKSILTTMDVWTPGQQPRS